MIGPVDPTTIETPVGYLDLARARANASRVAAYARKHGLAWRPHIKTHKARDVARLQLEAGAAGLTVATLREAEVMASLTGDLLLAYPPVGPVKVDRLLQLPDHVDLKVALDSAEALAPLAARAAASGRAVGVLVEVDMGLGRVGVQSPEALVQLAGQVASLPGVSFRGVLFYPGHIRVAATDQGELLTDLGHRLASCLGALLEAGLPPDIVSGGSTPSLWQSHRVPGMTEIRSGSCVFYDREALEVGVAALEDIAYTVLATVVSTSVPGHAVVDAGSKSLAREARAGDGFGFLLDRPEVGVASLSEEHGVLDLSATDWIPRVGEQVRVVPNHVCVSVNLQDHLLAVDGEIHRFVSLEARGRAPWTG